MGAPHSKGLELENALEGYFKALGYSVKRNVRLRGRSGAVHEIDILVRGVRGGRSFTLLVEAKAHSKPVSKEWVMKLAAIVRDVGADRGLLVASSGFTPGAMSVARHLGVELWDGEEFKRRVLSLEEGVEEAKYVLLRVDRRRVLRIVNAEASRRFLLLPDERLVDLKLLYYPLWLVRFRRRLTERRGLIVKRTVVKFEPFEALFDGLTGDFMSIGRRGLSRVFPRVSVEEAGVLGSLLDGDGDIHGEILLKLSEKGFVGPRDGGFLPSRRFLLYSPGKLNKVMGARVEMGVEVPHELTPSEVEEVAKSIWGATSATSVKLYYPIYIATLMDRRGTIRYVGVDGFSGARRDELALRAVTKHMPHP